MAALVIMSACGGGTAPTPPPAHLLAAGDIADCSSDGDEATAKLLDSLPGTIATLGDNVYPFASAQNFAQCFDPSWGRHKTRIRPAAGNHDYEQSSDAYYSYFGAAAGGFGKGFYSYDLGAWHLIVLNAEISTAATSEQIQWLNGDLAAAPHSCTLAYWHEPRFSSGPHGDSIGLQPLWQILYDANTDVILSGHDHDYERFAPQTPDGMADAVRGIREFVVGTGGSSHYQFVTTRPNSEFRSSTMFGVLSLALSDGRYDWKFIGIDGSVLDAGGGVCH